VLNQAQTVFCDWCLGNAVWWSNHTKPGQRLVVRFHAQERFTRYPSMVDFSRVAAVVFVSPWMMREAQRLFAIPPEKCLVVLTRQSCRT
jgi:hypothetical protein